MQYQILVAEDDEAIRGLVVDALTSDGFIVRSSFGAGALASLLAHPPHLLILDLMMPDIDGLEIRAQARQHPHTRNIPILVMTAFRHPERYFQDIGAAGYLVKPFNLETLYTMVYSILGIKAKA